MTKTMAEVLAEHSDTEMRRRWQEGHWRIDIICLCGAAFEGTHFDHQAAALTAAGFGLLASAWDEGHETGKRYPWGKRGFLTDDNPYRSES
jgi:hypothetical protein